MTESYSFSITRHADMVNSRRTAKQLAGQIGFDPIAQEEITLVVSELASNIIKYAGRGIIELQHLREPNRYGMMISAHDRGPGFDTDKALLDGYSSSGTLGVGLGAIKRLVDDMQINSRQSLRTGTDIVCKKWLAQSKTSLTTQLCPLDIGVISEAKAGCHVNGDAFVIQKDPFGNCLLAVIDGVGHGPSAHHAAQIAKNYIESHTTSILCQIFQGVESASQFSNGLVMALAYFDNQAATLTFASVGNIEAKVVGAATKVNLQVKRGIIGRQAPSPTVMTHTWHPGYSLVLHSDGLSSHWDWQQFAHLHNKPAQVIAAHMHSTLNKANDDATLVFVK